MKVEERKIFKDESNAKIAADLMKKACEVKATRIEIAERVDDAGIFFYITGYRELWAIFPKERKDELINFIKALANIKPPEEDIAPVGLISAKIDGVVKTFFVTFYPAKQYEERLSMGLNWGAPNKYEIDEESDATADVSKSANKTIANVLIMAVKSKVPVVESEKDGENVKFNIIDPDTKDSFRVPVNAYADIVKGIKILAEMKQDIEGSQVGNDFKMRVSKQDIVIHPKIILDGKFEKIALTIGYEKA